MKKHLLYPILALLPFVSGAQALEENFDDITTLAASGWTLTNQSSPLGTTTHFQGNPDVFPSYNGATSSYIGMNFNSTAGTGTISNWVITPVVNVQDGDILVFWTRTITGSEYNDRLEVRSSTDAMTVPSGATDVGSFTNLLLTINDGLNLSYPESWTRFEYVVAGVGATPVAMNFAFRYNVPNGGPTGTASDFIGIDAVFVGDPNDEPGEELCTPVLDCTDADIIANVNFGSINNTTTCSPDGYGDFTSMSTNVEAGSSYPISVTVGDGWTHESVSVWIDLDNSSTFDENEFTYIGTGSASVVSGTIAIPAGTPDGTYRMRVRLAAVGVDAATWDMACDSEQGYGETEDYSVVVGLGTGISTSNAAQFTYWPNPMSNVLNISAGNTVESISAFNVAGQQVLAVSNVTKDQIDVSSLGSGIYVFRVSLKGGETLTFKAIKE